MYQFNPKRCALTDSETDFKLGILHRYVTYRFLANRFQRGKQVPFSQPALRPCDSERFCKKRVSSGQSDAKMTRDGFNQSPAPVSQRKSLRDQRNRSVKASGPRRAPRGPEEPGVAAQVPFTIQLVWVRRPGKEIAKSLNLLNRLSAEGINVWVIEASNLVNLIIDNVADYDLILFEYFDHVASEMKSVVSRIRLGSRAPLMMLTDDQSVTWSLDALNAGVDAIFTVSTPDEVILARCNALLRRWLASA